MIRNIFFLAVITNVLIFTCGCRERVTESVEVPFKLDHNRMLVEGEMQRADGSWRKVKLWVDSGYHVFCLSETLALDLGMDISAAYDTTFKDSRLSISTPSLRVGGMELDTDSISTDVVFSPFWMFGATYADANLPSSILKKYHIVYDFPRNVLTIAENGCLKHVGKESQAYIHPVTGIVQLDAVLDGDSMSLALDIGASYSFISEETLKKYSVKHPEWKNISGTAGYANMWGWWPANEQYLLTMSIPEIRWGEEILQNVGLTGFPRLAVNGPTLGEWYSGKTAKPVEGFLGPNALKDYRVEIDYANNAVYLRKSNEKDTGEHGLAGISIRQLPDSTYQVVGSVHINGKDCAEGVEPGDIIVSIDGFSAKGATMGNVVDRLRGKPGEFRQIILIRNDEKINVRIMVDQLIDDL